MREGRESAGPPEAIALVGPTATGKTELAMEVARRLPIEVVSLDSRQVYRGMDIGTAKPPPEDRRRVPHHGIDRIDPGERYSAGRFAREARRWMDGIRGRGRVPVLVGGTGFFLRALTDPLFEEPELPAEPRRRLRRRLGRRPAEELLRWLERLDPESARRLRGGGGRQRMLRALEVALLSGRPLGWWHAHSPPREPPLRALIFLLDLPADALDRRIEARVDGMIDAGLPEEARRVSGRWGDDAPGMSATGYAELVPWLRGSASLGEARDAIVRNTRRYARRQRTWFRHQLPTGAVRLDARRPSGDLADEVAARWRAAVGGGAGAGGTGGASAESREDG